MNTSLFQELEAAINAVEPRVLEGYNPGLMGAEIDALMANVSFELPDDLRALYRWKNGSDNDGFNFLDGFWSPRPLTALAEQDHFHRIQLFDAWETYDQPPPFDLNETSFVELFSNGCGGDLVACCFKHRTATCEIRNREKDDLRYYLWFRGVEPMIQTALEWWTSGVFSFSAHDGVSPYDGLPYLDFETDFDKKSEIARRLNPNCDYWS